MSDATNDDLPLKTFHRGSEGAVRFTYHKHVVILHCFRVVKANEVARYVSDYGLDKPAQEMVIKEFGFRIVANDESVTIFRNSKKPVEVGDKRWHCNIRRNSLSASAVYGVSIQVTPVDLPNEVDFNLKHKMDAAFAVYREKVQMAEIELRNSLHRIALDSTRLVRESANKPVPSYKLGVPDRPPSKVVLPPSDKSKKQKKEGKTLIRFKKKA